MYLGLFGQNPRTGSEDSLMHGNESGRRHDPHQKQYVPCRNTVIKLTPHDETKKRAHDSEIVRAKENLKLSHGLKQYVICTHPSGWEDIFNIRKKPC